MAFLAFAACSPERPEVDAPADIDEHGAAIGAAAKEFVPDEILIQYEPGATESQKDSARAMLGATRKERIHTAAMKAHGAGELEVAKLPGGLEIAAAAEALAGVPGVVFAEPNHVYQHAVDSNDPYFTNGSLWGMYGDGSSPTNQFGSQAAEAWASGRSRSTPVYVAVIDEGIQVDHPDLERNIWTNPYDGPNRRDDDGNGYIDDIHGWDFVANDNSVYDGGRRARSDNHGTHVAGTIGAEVGNGQGVAGVYWDVKIISAKFLGQSGGTTANAIKAVDYITALKTRHNLNIVATNNSWGGGGFSQALLDAIGRANDANILFVAAAGNGKSNNDAVPFYPANYAAPNVISVAAIASDGSLATFSNFGATKVHIGAPGVGIVSTVPYDAYASFSGTSMATPHVTGAIALLAASAPSMNAAELKGRLLSAAVPTPSLAGKCVTGGRLDASGF